MTPSQLPVADGAFPVTQNAVNRLSLARFPEDGFFELSVFILHGFHYRSTAQAGNSFSVRQRKIAGIISAHKKREGRLFSLTECGPPALMPLCLYCALPRMAPGGMRLTALTSSIIYAKTIEKSRRCCKIQKEPLFACFDQHIKVFNAPLLGLFVRIEINIQLISLNQPASVPNLDRL